MKPIVITGAVLTVLLAIAFSVGFFLDDEHYNPGFYDYPFIIGAHVGLGAIYLGFCLVQFSTKVRAGYPMAHRVIGRVILIFGVASGLTAILAILLFPFSGSAMVFFVAPFAIYFVFALIRGFTFARRKNFVLHRNWMIRAFAIASAIATQRLILVPMLILLGTEAATIRWVSVFAFSCAFILHAVIAELWIRRLQVTTDH